MWTDAQVIDSLLSPPFLSEGEFNVADVSFADAAKGKQVAISIGADDGIQTECGFVDVTLVYAPGRFAWMDALGPHSTALVLFPRECPPVMPPIHTDMDHPLYARDFVSKDLRKPLSDAAKRIFDQLDVRPECIISAVLRTVTHKPMGKTRKCGLERVFSKDTPVVVSMHVDDIKSMIKDGVVCVKLEA